MADELLNLANSTLLKGKHSHKGTLLLSSHHLLFKNDNLSFSIPISTLKTVDKKFKSIDGQIPIYIQTQTFIFVRIFIPNEAQADQLYTSLQKLMNIESVDQLYAFQSTPSTPQIFRYDAVKEFSRQGLTKNWRISMINSDYSFSPSYPKIIIVPERISDNVLKHIGGFRSKSRIPSLSYIHRNGVSITRSSQPMVMLKLTSRLDSNRIDLSKMKSWWNAFSRLPNHFAWD